MLTSVKWTVVCKPQVPISMVKVTGIKCHVRPCPAHNFDLHWAVLFIFRLNVNLSEMDCCG
jgi:hypothetical protein